MIPELLSEQPHLREELERTDQQATDPALACNLTLVAPQPSSAPWRCILLALDEAHISVSANTGYVKIPAVGLGFSATRLVSTRKTRKTGKARKGSS
jgi:hypothetical protein